MPRPAPDARDAVAHIGVKPPGASGAGVRASSVRTVRALWGSSHPGPTLVVTALAFALGVATGLEPWRLGLLTLSVFTGQL